ncbi:MAG: ribbon-helix-helix protein, CopG family [Archaeoglobaceae archaeon]
MTTKSVKPKNVSLPMSYWEKIREIRKYLGVLSDSEAIRRAIDYFIEEKGISTTTEIESNNVSRKVS